MTVDVQSPVDRGYAIDVTRDDWLAAFARRLGVDPPDQATIDTLLALAGDAAHASERTAAPIACWLVGAAAVDPARARVLAAEISGGGA